MQRRQKRGWTLMLGSVLLPWTLVYGQASAPAPAPEFDRVGVLRALDRDDRSMTVNDTVYTLAPTLQVYVYERTGDDPQALRDERRRKSIEALRPGRRIGFTVVGEGSRKQGEVTEVWLLPSGHLPELDSPQRGPGVPASRTGTPPPRSSATR